MLYLLPDLEPKFSKSSKLVSSYGMGLMHVLKYFRVCK